MPRSSRLVVRSTLLALGFAGATGLGCVFYVEDTECGPFAYDYRGACYCEEGYEGSDPRGEGCDPVMTFRITDDCNDGADVAWKLFADERDWSWPAGDAVYVTPGLGFDGLEAIVCEFDELVCFGGETESGLVYGAGIDFTEDCSDCCFRCESREVDLGYLTCN